jgi:disease resistance protein RPM1
MPCLKSVELQVDVQAFNDPNFDVHHFYKLSYLRLLEKAHVGINCWGAKIEEAEEAEAALRHAVQSHPNRPRLILNRVGRCIDDKQVLLLFLLLA